MGTLLRGVLCTGMYQPHPDRVERMSTISRQIRKSASSTENSSPIGPCCPHWGQNVKSEKLLNIGYTTQPALLKMRLFSNGHMRRRTVSGKRDDTCTSRRPAWKVDDRFGRYVWVLHLQHTWYNDIS